MSEQFEWEIPRSAQPKPGDAMFDLEQCLSGVLALRATIPDDAFTASVLGTERAGNAVLIGGDGLVLTIGYLIAEAETVWLTTIDGKVVAGHALGYDYETGFGLVQALGALDVTPIPLGSSRALDVGDPVIVAGEGGLSHALNARITAKREFAGYWEYVLDEAIFTAPAHPNWGGTALIDRHGTLCGVGSLLVQQAGADEESSLDGNMIVPIDLFRSIGDELRHYGRVQKPSRPWLGFYVTEAEDSLVVAGLAPEAPAEQAGVEVGDVVLAVGGRPVGELIELFRSIWSLGEAGVSVPLTIMRDGDPYDIHVLSASRDSFFRVPRVH